METPTKPTAEWPGAFGVYRTAKQATRINVWTIVKLYVISTLIGLALGIIFGTKLEWIAQLLNILVSVWITIAITVTLLKSVAHEPIGAQRALEGAGTRYVDMFIMMVLMYLLYVISLVLFIIPFFFVFPRLQLAPYFLIDKKLGAIDAIKASWNGTKGNVGKMYGIIGATIVYALLIFTIIGIPFAIYFLLMYSTSSAVLYRHITGKPLAYISKDD